jgi:hypothetical protein
MAAMLHVLLLALVLADDPPASSRAHKPNPFAPSIPELTDAEEKKLDEIIDRFIRYDSGEVQSPEARRAYQELQKLEPKAIPALIRGLNRAAKLDYSCPAVTIARKLSQMFRSSRDPELLEYARENIGAGVTQSTHMGVLKDLRMTCLMRKRSLTRMGITAYVPTGSADDPAVTLQPSEGDEFRRMGLSQLIVSVGQERGERLRFALTELGRRNGEGVIGALGASATSYEGDVRRLAKDLLQRQLSKLSETALQKQLSDDHVEVRSMAAYVIGHRGLHLESALIDLLEDENAGVRQSARRALVKLAHGEDFGPRPNSDENERHEAKRQWRDWLAKKGSS